MGYRIAYYLEYTAMIGEYKGTSLDLFRGDPGFVGKGWAGCQPVFVGLGQVSFVTPLEIEPPANLIQWRSYCHHPAGRSSLSISFP
jgi:hypothetical protein